MDIPITESEEFTRYGMLKNNRTGAITLVDHKTGRRIFLQGDSAAVFWKEYDGKKRHLRDICREYSVCCGNN